MDRLICLALVLYLLIHTGAIPQTLPEIDLSRLWKGKAHPDWFEEKPGFSLMESEQDGWHESEEVCTTAADIGGQASKSLGCQGNRNSDI